MCALFRLNLFTVTIIYFSHHYLTHASDKQAYGEDCASEELR